MADNLQQAIKLIEAGNLEGGRQLLLKKLKSDPKNDMAWAWMAETVKTDELRRECLEEALKYNPGNERARRALEKLQGWSSSYSRSQAAPAPTAAPVTRSFKIKAEHSRLNKIVMLLALVLAVGVSVVTYFFTREDLSYRSEGRVMSATVVDLNKEAGNDGGPDQCRAEYQFMAYGALRKGTVTIPCSEMDSLDDSRRMQIQYLVSQPDRSRFYPPADTTERYAVMGFGMGALLLIVSIVSFVWGFLPKKSTQLLR